MVDLFCVTTSLRNHRIKRTPAAFRKALRSNPSGPLTLDPAVKNLWKHSETSLCACTNNSQRAPELISAESHRSKPKSHACPTPWPQATCPCQLGIARQPRHHGSTTQTATAAKRTSSQHGGHDQSCNEHTEIYLNSRIELFILDISWPCWQLI